MVRFMQGTVESPMDHVVIGRVLFVELRPDEQYTLFNLTAQRVTVLGEKGCFLDELFGCIKVYLNERWSLDQMQDTIL